MFCARRVFRCFKTLERWGDRITGAAGPYFVALAVILISLGTLSFFDIIAPSLSYPFLSIPICTLIAVNLFAHYFFVCTVRPGFVDERPRVAGKSLLWAKEKKGKRRATLTQGANWTKEIKITPAAVTKCRRCGQPRPERAHHCRICNRCVLKYDHHWINQCVGLHNERHFVMFMAYLVLATFCYTVLGYHKLLDSLGITYGPWPHRVPEVVFALSYILSAVMCLAVGVMLAWHLWGVSNGETSVEAQDHEQYRRKAKERSEDFINSYDLGKRSNLKLFFNVGENGYPLYTLILPLRIMPYTDGRSWARREGFDRHHGIRQGEELTDEDDDIEEDSLT